jgi:hypothetical protein
MTRDPAVDLALAHMTPRYRATELELTDLQRLAMRINVATTGAKSGTRRQVVMKIWRLKPSCVTAKSPHLNQNLNLSYWSKATGKTIDQLDTVRN